MVQYNTMSAEYTSVAFDGLVTPIEGVNYFTPEKIEPQLVPNFDDPEMLDMVRGLPTGHVLLSDAVFMPDIMSTARFVEIDALKRTREDTQRGEEFKFGQLIVGSMSVREAAMFVAVKPHDTARQAVHEYSVMRFLNSLSPAPFAHSTFEPIGFYANPQGGKTSLITHYELSVISYDNIFWHPDFAPTLPEVRHALGNCALSLGYLHARGIENGDNQIKNNASGSIGGARYNDPESYRSMFTRRNEVDPIVAQQRTRDNIVTLLRSIRRNGEDYDEQFMVDFAPVYLGMINQPASQLPIDARLTAEDLYDIVEDV